jgi:hypothetical protein
MRSAAILLVALGLAYGATAAVRGGWGPDRRH